jgi:predicted transcriptional regulator
MMGAEEIMSKVWSHMSSNPFSIEFTSTLKDAVESMVKHGIGNLVVKDGASIGLLTEREILLYLYLFGEIPDKELRDIMLRKFTKVSPNTPIDEAAKTMISTKTRLLVYEQNNLVGIITTSDLANAFLNTTDRNPSLESMITKNIFSLEHSYSVLEAIKLMYNRRVGSIIVTVHGLYDGIFTERDLLTKILNQNVGLTNEVGNYCSNFMLTARLGIRTREAAKLMFANNIKRLPITNNGRVVGIVTARDLVESFISE